MKKMALRLGFPALTLLLALSSCGTGEDLAGTPIGSLADSGAGSLRQAVADAKAGDTLRLTSAGTLTLASPIVTDKNLTIIAAGVTLDAAGKGRVLEVPAGVTVTVQGGTLTGGVGKGETLAAASAGAQATATVSTWGGNLINRGTLTLDGTTIQGGSANNGGGIFNELGATLTLKNVTMTGNKATIPTPDLQDESTGSGGAIANRGTLTIESGTFKGNTAVYTGGVIRHTYGTLSILGGTFEGNSITSTPTGGGGVLGLFGAGVATISGGTFNGNTTGSGENTGGGVVLQSSPNSTMTISGGSFTGNSSAYGGVYDIYQGGSLKLSGGTFEGNTASKYGGAFQFNNQTTAFDMTGGTLKGNKAGQNGGAINSDAGMTLTGGTIEGNAAGDSGGGLTLYAQDGKQVVVTLGGTLSVKNNSATKQAGGLALFASDKGGASLTVNMTGGTVEGNTAGSSGGMHLGRPATLNLSGGSIQNNTARLGGGVTTSGKVNITGGKIQGNKATASDDGGGGLRLASGSVVTMSGGEISGNSAALTGGGVLVGNGANFSMTAGSIAGNSTGGAATSGGGGGLRLYAGSKATLSGGTISNNKSDYGGGLKSDEAYAPASLGPSELTVSGATISGNQATAGKGGGIHAGGKVTIQSGNITGNTATQQGGGVFVRNVASYSQTGGTISGNTPDQVFNEP